MPYEITFLSKETITPGNCLTCYLHFINMNPNPGEPATGCELSGEFLPDDWDTEKVLWIDVQYYIPMKEAIEECSTSLGSWFETSGSHGACCSTTWRRRWIFRRQSCRLLSAEKSRFLTGSFPHSKRTMALATPVPTCCPSLLRIEVIDI